MKTKSSDLIGQALNWAVAQCDDRRIGFNHGGGLEVRGRTEDGEELPEAWDLWMPWHPSTDWAQGGPIIEREGIEVVRGNDLYFPKGNEKGDHYESLWIAKLPLMDLPQGYRFHGPTALIAAMRCFCSAKFGDEIDIPEELCQQPKT